jgi:hypothetical protein
MREVEHRCPKRRQRAADDRVKQQPKVEAVRRSQPEAHKCRDNNERAQAEFRQGQQVAGGHGERTMRKTWPHRKPHVLSTSI